MEWEPVETFDGERLRPLLFTARNKEWEPAAELLIPFDGSPLTLEALQSRAARRFSLAPAAVRARVCGQALDLARSGPPEEQPRPVHNPAAKAGRPRKTAGGPEQLALFGEAA